MTAPVLTEGKVYEVGVRRIVNRPNTISRERLRYAGIYTEAGRQTTGWLPEWQNLGQQITHLTLDQIASLDEVPA